MIDEKETYTKDEVIEILRQVLFYGDPDYYEGGGKFGGIPYKMGGTREKAEDFFNHFYLKRPRPKKEGEE